MHIIQPTTPSRSSGTSTSAGLQKKSEATKTVTAYRLSRVQAEGWNAARRIPSTALDGFDAKKIERLNPYASDPERTRWSAGFESALKA
jgi:hypothetical protein